MHNRREMMRRIAGGLVAGAGAHVGWSAAAQAQSAKPPAVRIDPANLAQTATETFRDDFDALQLYQNGAGVWESAYWWAPPKGATLVNNGESQWYVNSAFERTSGVKPWSVKDGMLTIEAARTPADIKPLIDNYEYTSGMLTTYRTFAQTYGYFEMRAKLPAGKGLWPAFWLLPIDRSWPPEIDIMEVLGHEPTTLVVTAHAQGPNGNVKVGEALKVADTTADFHTYGVDWQPDSLTWYFDGKVVHRAPTPPALNKPMYVLLNLAVGGHWPGAPDAKTVFPAHYVVDYVRAYKAKDA